MKITNWVRLVVVLFTLLIVSPTSIKADVGDTGGFGGDDSESSDGSSSSLSSEISNYYMWNRRIKGEPSPLLLVGAIVYGVFVFLKTDRGNTNNSSSSQFNYEYIDEVAITESIRKNNAQFSVSEFASFAETAFMGVQNAWSNLDTQAMRSLTSDSLFKVYDKQINDYIESEKRNVLSQQVIRDITISNYRIDGNQEVITVRVNASLVDYTVKDKTNILLRGKKTRIFQRSYRVEFVRDCSMLADNTNTLEDHCPGCGAPVTATAKLECKYCLTLLGNSNNEWLMNKYSAWIRKS